MLLIPDWVADRLTEVAEKKGLDGQNVVYLTQSLLKEEDRHNYRTIMKKGMTVMFDLKEYRKKNRSRGELILE